MSDVTEKLFAIIRANEEKELDTQIHVGDEEWALLRADVDASRNIQIKDDGTVWFAGCRVMRKLKDGTLINP